MSNLTLYLLTYKDIYYIYNIEVLQIEAKQNEVNLSCIYNFYTEINKCARISSYDFAVMMYSMVAIFLLIPLTPVFLDIIRPLNESRPRFFAVTVELRVDQEKYLLCTGFLLQYQYNNIGRNYYG